MNVISTYPGSFGIHLGSVQTDDLFGKNVGIENTFQLAFDLICAGDNSDQLRKLTKKISNKAILSYKTVLQSLNTGKVGAKFSWHSSGEKLAVQLPLPKIRSILKVLSHDLVSTEEKIDVTGELIAIDIKRKKFKLVNEENQVYSGDINLPPEVVFKVPQKVKAVLKVDWEINVITDKENPRYTMIDIE